MFLKSRFEYRRACMIPAVIFLFGGISCTPQVAGPDGTSDSRSGSGKGAVIIGSGNESGNTSQSSESAKKRLQILLRIIED